MKLRIITPTQKVVDVDDVVSLRAEDESGAFGVLPHHIAFLTILPVSVVSWKKKDGREEHAAVRGGVLRTLGGNIVEIAARDAVSGRALSELSEDVLERFSHEEKMEALSKTATAKLNLAVIRRLQKYLEAGRVRVSTRSHRGGDDAAMQVGAE